MCIGQICNVPLMKVENCFISLPIQSALFSHTYTQRERWLILMEIIIPSFVVAMQCKAYQHFIVISTLPKICTTLHAALTTHIWYVYSTYNYLSGTCRPKRSYAAHMPHIMLALYVGRPQCVQARFPYLGVDVNRGAAVLITNSHHRFNIPQTDIGTYKCFCVDPHQC